MKKPTDVYILSFLAVCSVIITVLSQYPIFLEKYNIIYNSKRFGDMYPMSRVKTFKIPVEQIFPQGKFASVQDAEIIVMGDSFSNVRSGYPSYSTQMQSILKKPVHGYNIYGSGEDWRKTNPIDYLQEHGFKNDGKERILILESVDRGMAERYISVKNLPKKRSQVEQNPNNPIIPLNTDKTPPQAALERVTYKNNILTIEGWATDKEEGSPVRQVTLFLNGKPLGTAQTNIPRADVAEYFSQPTWGQSGMSYSNEIELAPGTYTVTAKVEDTAGNIGKENTVQTFSVSSLIPLQRNLEKVGKGIDAGNEKIAYWKKSLDYFLGENQLLFPFFEYLSSMRFDLFKEITSQTPNYAYTPRLLFFQDEIKFYQNPWKPEEISQTAENISAISTYLKDEYNIRMIFIPMPNKYTVNNKYAVIPENTYNPFFPNLYAELDKRNVEYVDLYHPFTATDKGLYQPTDTHLNKEGVDMYLQETIKKINTQQ